MEILNIAIPALIVFLTAYLLLDKMLKNEEKRRMFELRKANLPTITPIRLRAYERLTLFLERISPNTLVVNSTTTGMTSIELHAKLLETIRQEYSHNISQQVYVSENVWLSVNAAKESMIQLINTCAMRCGAEQPATVLAELIISVYASTEDTPIEIALKNLKEEVGRYF